MISIIQDCIQRFWLLLLCMLIILPTLKGNAVMHVEDEQYGESEVVEVLQKGYIRGDKVLRYAMVKVAN